MEFLVTTVSSGLGFTNKLYFNPDDVKKFSNPKNYVYLSKHKQYFGFSPDARVPSGSVAIAQAQLIGLNLQPQVDRLKIDWPAEKRLPVPELVALVIDVSAKASVTKLSVPELEEAIRSAFASHPFSACQRLVLQTKEAALRLLVDQTEPLHGFVGPKTLIRFDSSSGISLSGNPHSQQARLIPPGGFDFSKLGIGGLDKEFETMFTDAFALRLFDPVKVQETGLKPVKGIVLYGPPGTGKTTIARKLGELLNCAPPIIKSGPELLNRYVGGGEKLIRELFEPAEKEWADQGIHSRLHLIIIDEIDAVARARGNSSSSNTDSLVNQLLVKMDGPKEGAMQNFLIIAMTNRLSLLDKAFLRPGRFELQLEIGLPDAAGRLQILNIHSAGLRKAGKLASDVDLAQLAKATNNYTGSEIEGLVKKAAARGLRRLVDPKMLDETTPDWGGLIVTKQDFDNCIAETKPMFGIEPALERKPIVVPYGPSWESLLQDGTRFVNQVRDTVPFFSMLVEGPPATGKTTLGRHLAKSSCFPFLRVVSPSNMAGKSELQKIAYIREVMEDSYRVERGIILFEHIERLFSWTAVGPSFSNIVLQELITAFTEPLNPPRGHLMVIATSSKPDAIRMFELEGYFNAVLKTRALTTDETITFLQSVFEDKTDMIADVKAYLPKEIPVKTLQTICTAIKLNPTSQDFLFNLARLTRN